MQNIKYIAHNNLGNHPCSGAGRYFNSYFIALSRIVFRKYSLCDDCSKQKLWRNILKNIIYLSYTKKIKTIHIVCNAEQIKSIKNVQITKNIEPKTLKSDIIVMYNIQRFDVWFVCATVRSRRGMNMAKIINYDNII